MAERRQIVVIGSGIAAMISALKASEKGAKVHIISPVPHRRAANNCYRDGMAAVLNPILDDDSIDRHIYDTVLGGDFLADQSTVTELCKAAPALVRLCERMGVLFNRTPEGMIHRIRTAGNSARRTVYADFLTGHQAVLALDGQVRRLEVEGKIQKTEGFSFCSLIKDDDGSCCGVVVIDVNTHEFRSYPADAVILCAEGYAGLYATTTAPISATGAEITQCYLQGAAFANPEFVHCHYSMGGLWIDRHHMTTLPGLFAAGESDYSYHGANCLGANIIPASLFGGLIAGEGAVEYAEGIEKGAADTRASLLDREKDRQEGELKLYLDREEGENPRIIRRELRELIDRNMGDARDGESLKDAEDKILELKDRFGKCRPADRSQWANDELHLMRVLSKQLELARILVLAAYERKESRGAHVRKDYPVRDDGKWSVITKVTHVAEGPELNYDERVDAGRIQPVTR